MSTFQAGLVISAYSADFARRACGAIALHACKGYMRPTLATVDAL